MFAQKEKMQKIDYTELSDRIVEQAYEGLQILSKEEANKLIQDKFDRAVEFRKSLENSKFLG